MAATKPDDPAITLRLPDDLQRQLERMSADAGRPRSRLVEQAVRDFLRREAWLAAEIRRGIEAADRGELAADSDLHRAVERWREDRDS